VLHIIERVGIWGKLGKSVKKMMKPSLWDLPVRAVPARQALAGGGLVDVVRMDFSSFGCKQLTTKEYRRFGTYLR
jgi:hypothetical protein